MQTVLVIPDKASLQYDWLKVFGRPAPTGCHPSFLHKAKWQKQVNQLGGLSASERRQLVGESRADNASHGTRLVRVWQGETHQVTVLVDGYLYQDQHWKSLSAIAKAITGTPWSGPVFFGIKKS
jgi:hypothetical protein